MVNSSLIKLNEIFLIKNNITYKFIITIRLFRLGGLPPLLGFLGKINAILIIIIKINPIILTTIILASLLSLFYYIKLTYNAILNSNQEIKVNNLKDHKIYSKYAISITVAGNLMAPLLVSLI
jgi:NADH:ubiquinone oxidoreductase subunit 2 (subunit N)